MNLDAGICFKNLRISDEEKIIHPSLTEKAQLLYDIVGKGRAHQVTSLAGMVTSPGQNALTRSPNKDNNYTKDPLEYNPQDLV